MQAFGLKKAAICNIVVSKILTSEKSGFDYLTLNTISQAMKLVFLFFNNPSCCLSGFTLF
jgi:hypothetical protein